MMSEKENSNVSHHMTPETMEAFIQNAKDNKASENMVRRFSGTVRAVYDFLPEDKLLTRERLLEWRKGMEEQGYASITILNYVKYINRYLDFVGCSEIRFNRGKGKDISDMTFGYLTARYPTDKRDRGDIVWVCECKCGKFVELPATRLLVGNTLSCGCLHGEILKRANKNIDGTNLRQHFEGPIENPNTESGYVGVSRKRDKWQAHITYKGRRYSLGCYHDLQDAVKARARGKELVLKDAEGLLDFYTELEKSFHQLPNRSTEPDRDFPTTEWVVNDTPSSAAIRNDNTSGHTGVVRRRNKWESKICFNGRRYFLGSFDNKEDAVAARKRAEADLHADPSQFESKYQAEYRYYDIRKAE